MNGCLGVQDCFHEVDNSIFSVAMYVFLIIVENLKCFIAIKVQNPRNWPQPEIQSPFGKKETGVACRWWKRETKNGRINPAENWNVSGGKEWNVLKWWRKWHFFFFFSFLSFAFMPRWKRLFFLRRNSAFNPRFSVYPAKASGCNDGIPERKNRQQKLNRFFVPRFVSYDFRRFVSRFVRSQNWIFTMQ